MDAKVLELRNDAPVTFTWTIFIDEAAGSMVGAAEGESTSCKDNTPVPWLGVNPSGGILEPGESVAVAPIWWNASSQPRSLSGTASSFTGPTPAAYILINGDAEYGEIAAGATATCQESGDCYEMAVDVPAVRPATLWEATFEESLSSGDTKTWTLHIGDSFTDVPRSSLFYTAIETLLGSGVTGGCTTTEYCPNDPVTRGQMALFITRSFGPGGSMAAPRSPNWIVPPCLSLLMRLPYTHRR